MGHRLILLLVLAVGLLSGLTAQESPEMIKIDALENLFHAVNFAHGRHAEMATMSGGCAVCHHNSEDDVFMPCADCHDPDPASGTLEMPSLNAAYHRNCLSCHREWANQKVCETCHRKKLLKRFVNPKKGQDPSDIMGVEHPPIPNPELLLFTVEDMDGVVYFHHREHIDLYQYDCTACHRQDNCAKCHKYQISSEPPSTHLSAPHDPCSNCHDTEDGDCETCHRDVPLPGFTHDLTGWPLKAYHADNNCNSCHPPGQPVQALSNSCSGCHNNFEVGLFDHARTGLALSESHIEIDCYECHSGNDFTGTPICSECHDEDVSFPDMEPGEYLK